MADKHYAIILAAGVGGRLRPMTDFKPKSLIRVNGREILDYQIQGYLSSGINESNIYITTGYMSDEIEAFLEKKYPLVHVVYSKNYLNTNNMYSLYLSLLAIKKYNNFDLEQVYINNADCIYEENLMREFISCDYENAIAVDASSYLEESMKVTVDNNNRISDINKIINSENAFGVSVDLYKFSKNAIIDLFSIIENYIEVKKDLKQWSEVAFPHLFTMQDVFPFDIRSKKWVEVDNYDDLLQADNLFSDFKYDDVRAYILDLDGTLFIGNTPIKNAIDFVKNHENIYDFYFLSNNTSRTPSFYVDKIRAAGINVSSDKIITPLLALIEYIREKAYSSVFLIANESVTSFLSMHLENVSFEFNLEKNQALILTYDTEINYAKICDACLLLNKKNVDFIATHHDVFCPTEEGPIPDIGSFIKMIESTNGKTPNIILGKPNVNLVKQVTDKYDAKLIAVVGDRIYTDKALADNIGSHFICVLTGETTRVDVELSDTTKPSIILKCLGA